MMCRCLDDMGRAEDKCIDFIEALNWVFLDANILLQSPCGVVA